MDQIHCPIHSQLPFIGFQIPIDHHIPLPVVIKRLDRQRNKNHTPQPQMEMRKSYIGCSQTNCSKENKTKGIRQFVHRYYKRSGISVPAQKIYIYIAKAIKAERSITKSFLKNCTTGIPIMVNIVIPQKLKCQKQAIALE